MRRQYKWYLAPTSVELEEIWSTGILTLDTNVLLDLYRYHETTRTELLSALSDFENRVWLSNQASKEFIRNRTTVIAGAAKTFKQAVGAIEVLAKAVETARNSLRSHRLIPASIADELFEVTGGAIEKANRQTRDAEAAYPNYFDSDPVLESILKLFDGAVGPSPSSEELVQLHKDAQARIDEQVPPGYLDDDDKQGDERYGDYILWSQVLDYAKQRDTPLILVTSERKEDWWERHSGKRVGPRRELLHEAFERSGQRVLIYQTERFVKMAAERRGQSVAPEVVAEIRSLSRSRDEPAVQTEQMVASNSPSLQYGLLKMNLLRPLRHLTCTGRLQPEMTEPPEVAVQLLKYPDESPAMHVRGATGTCFDFNIHVKSAQYGIDLPSGEYVFRYTARSSPEDDEREPSTKTSNNSSAGQRSAEPEGPTAPELVPSTAQQTDED